MKSILCFLFCLTAYYSFAQETTLSPAVLTQLDSAETVMWGSLQDVSLFDRITGDDYITLNADGMLQNKAQTLEKIRTAPLPKADVDLSEKKQRIYGNVVIKTGRAKVHKGGLLLTEFIFTQIWIYRDSRWQFIGWQGTYSGIPAYYPVFMTLFLLGLLWLIVRLIRRRLRGKSTKNPVVKPSV